MSLKKILPVFSYVFHPMFVPVYAALVYFFYVDSSFTAIEKYYTFFQIVIITIVLPALFFLLLRSAGKVESIMMADVAQRKLPLVILCFLIILLLKKSVTLDRFPELHFFFLGTLLSTILALGFLFFNIKVSLHMIAMSALTLFIIGLSIHQQTKYIYLISFMVLMNGFVASSRLEMNAHTNRELFIGFVFGSIPQLLMLPLWL